jgi:hypothetical protein
MDDEIFIELYRLKAVKEFYYLGVLEDVILRSPIGDNSQALKSIGAIES